MKLKIGRTFGMKKIILLVAAILAFIMICTGCAPFLGMNMTAEATPAPEDILTPPTEAPKPEQTSAPELPTPSPTQQGNVYEDDILGFEITLPDGWSVRDGAFYETSGSIEVYSEAYAPDNALVNITYMLDQTASGFAATAEDFIADQAAQSGAEGDLIYSAEDDIGQYPCFAMTYMLVYPDGDVLTTVLYVIDDGYGACYFLYYGLGGDMSIDDGYVAEAEEIIRSFNITGADFDPSMLEEQTSTDTQIEEQVFEPDDFMFLSGMYTPADIIAAYGSTNDVEEDEYTIMLNYNNMSVAFFKDPNSGYTEAYVNGVTLLDASAPVGVGGVQVGMYMQDAQAIIESNGYTQNMDIWEGAATLFYEFYDEHEELCFVSIDTLNGVVSQVTAMWGPYAFDARDSML